MMHLKLIALPALLTLTGCAAASAVADLATAPVRVVKTGSTVIDKMTTSQSEQDQKRGKAIRQREERLGELESEYRKQARKCEGGDEKACRNAQRAYYELRTLMPQVPYEPR